MWRRRELKDWAKTALHRNYWKIVLVSVILLLLGCETGGISFHKTTYHYNEEGGAGELKSGPLPTGTKSAISVKKAAGSDEVTVQRIGGGKVETDKIEVSFFEGMFIGFIAVVIFLVIFLAVFAVILAVDIFLINPFSVGGKRFMIKSVEDVAQVKEIAFGFDHSYRNIVKVMFQRGLRIFLWSLLLIVPGIVKMYEYYMVPYILAENPDVEYKTALQMSRDMMEGQKWKTFVLGLSFILWHFLGAVTFGIVEVFYVQPYRNLTFAALYARLKNTPVFDGGTGAAGGQNGMAGQYEAGAQYGTGGYTGTQYGAGGYADGSQR